MKRIDTRNKGGRGTHEEKRRRKRKINTRNDKNRVDTYGKGKECEIRKNIGQMNVCRWSKRARLNRHDRVIRLKEKRRKNRIHYVDYLCVLWQCTRMRQSVRILTISRKRMM